MKTLQISFENRAGHTLRGFANLPDDTHQPVPCVLLLHGFTGNACGYKGLNTRIGRTLAENGIGCVRFDFYGNGESDGEFEDCTFSNLYTDAEDMFSWLRRQDFADPDRLYLSGQSMGGYVAASCAPRLQPKGLVLLCPGAAMWFGCAQKADMVTQQGTDWVDMEGLKYSMRFNYDMASHPNPFEEAKGYDGPVVIIRANDDKLVDENAVSSYCAVYKDPQVLTTAGGGHNFASIPARQALTEKMVEFIREQG